MGKHNNYYYSALSKVHEFPTSVGYFKTNESLKTFGTICKKSVLILHENVYLNAEYALNSVWNDKKCALFKLSAVHYLSIFSPDTSSPLPPLPALTPLLGYRHGSAPPFPL